MAKSVKAKAAKKTGNRRVKRTIRRTVGALCMISAITVAAIPVPENLAYDPAGGEHIADYGSGDFTIHDLDPSLLTNCNVTDPYSATAYTIAKAGGDWQLDWQFRYYSSSPGADGYIQYYNSQYQVKNVALNYRVFSDFINISDSDYTKYYNESTNRTVSIDVMKGDNPTPHHTVSNVLTLGYQYGMDAPHDQPSSSWATGDELTYKFFIDNLPDVYNQYKAEFDQAYTYELDGDDTTIPQWPNAVVKTYKDVYKTDAERQQFLCDQLFEQGTPMSLEIVQERVYSGETPTGWRTIRVPKLVNRPEGEGTSMSVGGHTYSYDDTGFLAGDSRTICGIEPNAFKGVQNVETLTMDDHIRYIGNNAFENSFVQSVTFSKDATIGNRAFKNCNSLAAVTIPKGVTTIGTEAFAGTILRSVDIPSTVTVIGDGAFYNCQKLTSVNFQDDGSLEQSVGAGAFFNCIGLNEVNFNNSQVTGLGYGCFAVSNTETGNLDTFDMPNFIVAGESSYNNSTSRWTGIGEYLLANRLKLKKVYMPDNLKGASDGGGDISSTFVSKCQNLACVEFPDSACTATFDPTTFYDVTNSEFYVRGPKLDTNKNVAKPRTSTWVSTFNAKSEDGGVTYKGTPVPYVYNEAGMDYYEVCKDEDNDDHADYIMCIDQNGKLVSCTFPQGDSGHTIGADEDNAFTIPAQVGTITVSALGEGCFEDTSVTKGVKDFIKYLKIEDGSGIQSLNPEVFKGAKQLEGVDIGNSVNTIGKSCFEDCPELKTVTIGENIQSLGDSTFHNCPKLTEIRFDSPTNPAAFTLANIGSNALSTGSDKLTVYGDIGATYGPFAWSMQSDNFVDPEEGVRVCYKTNAPTNMTVILDNTNGLPTLVDYPHLDQLDDYAKAIGLDGGDPSYSLIGKINSGAPLSNKEQQLYNAVVNIDIPEGIRSIDVKGYINNPAPNGGYSNLKNVEAYLKNDVKYYPTYSKYGLFNGYYGTTDKSYTYDAPDTYYLKKISGETANEGTSVNLKYEGTEENPSGNDIIESVTMCDVEYLPDLAFYNCEKLNYLALGDDIQDVGELPIADCDKLTSIAIGNNKYVAENGILYENLADGTKKVVECFPGQGKAVGSTEISTNYHPNLDNVSEIAEGAFSDCDYINFVDLTGVDDTSVPKYCFYDCDSLRDVTIPANMDEINENSFGKDPSIILEIENPDLVLAADSFGDFITGENPVIYTQKGSIVEKMSTKLGSNKLPAILRYLPYDFKITYVCGVDGNILHVERVNEGDYPTDYPIPNDEYDVLLRDHISQWSGPHAGLVFSHYADESGNVYKNIRRLVVDRDMLLTLVYVPEGNVTPDVSPTVSPDVTPTPGPITPGVTTSPTPTPTPTQGTTPGTTPSPAVSPSTSPVVSVTPSPTGSPATKYQLTVVYGSGTGQYPAGTKVIIEAIDAPAGKVFDKWVVTGAAATVYSSTSKATTVTTAAGETVITATYKDAGSGSGSSSGGGGGTKAGSTGTYSRTGLNGSPAAGTGSSTRVDITKPGISDVDKAYASVSGSTDSFVVKITESADAANQVATALANKYGDMTPIKYFAMDISLYDATGMNKITDTTNLKVNVTMPIPDALRQYAGNNKVGAVVNGTQLEDLACKFTTVDGVPCVSFTATHFSPYTIYVDTNNLQVGYMDSSPKTGDPIHPKWFVTIALAATSLFLFLKKDKVIIPKATA